VQNDLHKKIALSWSSGKDCAWALHLLRQTPGIEVAALLTTFDSAAGRVAMHRVPRRLVEAQAERAGLPLWAVELPWPCTNAGYEQIMRGICERAIGEGLSAVAFGDLFLRDIRKYRERQLSGTGLEPLFPLWDLPTAGLALEMVRGGVKAKVTCVELAKLDRTFAGREFDDAFIGALPPEVDACGENGEFHTFVYDAPVFSTAVPVTCGEITELDGFVFADLL
jgi:uncharacterized protein (TIGR00290 family)